MKPVHYFSRELTIFEHKGTAVCGTYINKRMFVGDRGTTNRREVTCENCKRTRLFKRAKDVQECCRCGKVVGCDKNGRKHRCRCGK